MHKCVRHKMMCHTNESDRYPKVKVTFILLKLWYNVLILKCTDVCHSWMDFTITKLIINAIDITWWWCVENRSTVERSRSQNWWQNMTINVLSSMNLKSLSVTLILKLQTCYTGHTLILNTMYPVFEVRSLFQKLEVPNLK
jgi:hypothetical protein